MTATKGFVVPAGGGKHLDMTAPGRFEVAASREGFFEEADVLSAAHPLLAWASRST